MAVLQDREGLPKAIIDERRFFELYANSKSATPKGWNTPANWKTLDEIPENKAFGFAVGNNSTFLLVDYDHVVVDGRVVPWIRDVIKRLRTVCSTYFETSMSGTGYHQIVDLGDYAESFAPESNGYNSVIVDMALDKYNALSKEERDKVPKIEFWFKTEGRYVFLTGKHKVFNEVAVDDQAAAFFKELLKIRTEMHDKYRNVSQSARPGAVQETAQGVRFEIDEATRDRVLEALPFISADCSREDWVHVGIALHHCGFDFDVWDTWSRFRDQTTGEASDKYVEGETEKIWESFKNNKSRWNAGTIIAAAMKNGYRPSKSRAEVETLEEKQTDNRDYDACELPELTEDAAIQYSIEHTGQLPFVTNTDGGVSKSSFTNYVLAVGGDAYLDRRIRFNEFDGRITFTGFYWDTKPHPARDADLANLRYFVDRRYNLNNKANMLEAVTKIACDHPFHPVREFLSRLEWDGVPRISELLPRYLGAEKSDYTTAVTKLLLFGAIQRVMNPGCKFDYCIVLQDKTQGTGKSTLCRLLALNDEWYTDSIGNLGDNKGVFELMRGKWIIELGEMLAVRRASDVETIKAFITRQSQDYRQPYGVFAETHPRQCIFIGTSNKPQFLPEDKTGNRRFLPVMCDGKKNAVVHPLKDETETRAFVTQCYAEALVIGSQEGFPLVLDARFNDELLRIQETATPEDTWVGMIQSYLDETDLTIVCTRLIWDSVFAGDNDREPKRFELNDIAEIMELHIDGWERYKGRDGSNSRAKYKFKVYGTQNAWQKIGGKRKKRFSSEIQHNGVVSSQEEKVASGVATMVASKVASAENDGFEQIEESENLPFD